MTQGTSKIDHWRGDSDGSGRSVVHESAFDIKASAIPQIDDRFQILRAFNAPRALVWRAWTEPERISAWLGPKDMPPGRAIRHELRAGGVLISAMKMPDGSEICAKFAYREITPSGWSGSFDRLAEYLTQRDL